MERPLSSLEIVGDPPDLSGRVCRAFLCAPFIFEGELVESANQAYLLFDDGVWRSFCFDMGTAFWRVLDESPVLAPGHPDAPFNPRTDTGAEAGVIGQRLARYDMTASEQGARIRFRFESGRMVILEELNDRTNVRF